MAGEPNQPVSYWVSEISRYAPVLREQLINDLVGRGIARREESKRLMVFKSVHYPANDPMVVRDLKRRLYDILLSDEIPSPEDVALIGLARASRLLDKVVRSNDLDRIEPRIEQLAKMDLIGLSVNRALDEIQAAIALAVAPI